METYLPCYDVSQRPSWARCVDALGSRRNITCWLFILLLLPAVLLAHNGELILVRPVQNITIDGDLADWSDDLQRHPINHAEMSNKPTDAADFTGAFRMGYDPQENALYLAVEIEDQSTVLDLERDYDERWQNRDGCIIQVDLEHHSGENNVLSLLFLGDSGFHFSGEHYGAGYEHFKVASQYQDTVHRYEWRVDVGRLGEGQYRLQPGTVLGLGVEVKDKDADGTYSIMTWGDGLAKERYPDARSDVLLVENAASTASLNGQVHWADDHSAAGRVRVYIAPQADTTAWMSVNTGRDGRFATTLPSGTYRLRAGRGRHPDEQTVVHIRPGAETAGVEYVLAMQPPTGVSAQDTGKRQLAGPGRRNGAWVGFGRKDGVPGAHTQDMLQDWQGHMWFTLNEKGFMRYDGEYFTRYDSLDGLPINAYQLHEDRQGHLWIATTNGLLRQSDGHLTRFSREDGLVNNKICTLAEDNQGHLWIATQIGVSRFDGERFVNYTTEDGLPANRVIQLIADRKGRIWVATTGGVGRFDGGERFRDLSRPQDPPQFYINDLMEDSRGHIWVNAVEGGTWRYTEDEVEYYRQADGLENDFTMYLGEDAQGRVWVSAGGANRFDGERFQPMIADSGDFNDDAFHFLLDRQGAFWIGTNTGGLVRADSTGFTRFTRFTMDDGLASNGIWSLLTEDRDGRLWIPHGQDGSFTRYDNDRLRNFTTQDGLAHREVYRIVGDRHGHLWFATRGGLSRFDGERFTSLTTDDGLPDNWVRTVAVDNADHVWFATTPGGAFVGHIGYYDGNAFTLFDRSDGLQSTSGYALLPDSRGSMWLGLINSLSRYDGRSFQTFTKEDIGTSWGGVFYMVEDGQGRLCFIAGWELFRYDGRQFDRFGEKEGFRSHGAVFCDRDGRLWFGDKQDSGVYRFANDRFESIGPEQGLEVDQVLSMAQDERGHMWFATPGGAVRYDGQISQTFNRDDGLLQDRVNHIFADPDGYIWLATSAGVTRYQPGLTAPSVRLKGIIADRVYEPAGRIELPSTQDLIAFEFRGRSMSTPANRMAYRYRLQGHHEDWRVVRSERVEYQDLPRGDYVFEVQAVDHDLNYSAPVQVQVIVHLPYERLGWGVSLSLAFGLIALQGGRIVRDRRRLKSSNTALEQQTEDLRIARDQANAANHAKSEFLANISHEIRTPMNAILGYTQILGQASLKADQHRAVDTIQRSGNHLLGLINNVLDLSKIESGHAELQPADFDLHGLLATLDVMFRMRCEQKGLGWRIKGGGDTQIRVHGEEAKLSQVLINLLGNAVKFTEKGEVVLQLDIDAADHYVFSVRDTGAGISVEEQQRLFEPFQRGAATQKQEGTGLGLAIARRNVELLGGDLRVESEPDKGSRFFFSLVLPPALGQPMAAVQSRPRRLALGVSVRALVVDDVAENRDILRQFLESAGVAVELAAGGEEALELVTANLPDIVFLDIRMPQMGGEEVLRRLQMDDALRAVPVVAVTASVLEHERQRFVDAGFRDFIPKPFQAERIYACLARVLPIEWEDGEVGGQEGSVVAQDWNEVRLPADLRQRLTAACQSYSVTDLEDGLVALEAVGDAEGRLAAHLRTLKQQYDMPGIQAVLDDVRPAE